MEVVNPFENESEAERYERYRPKYHHIPFEHIRKIVGREFESSLDVACGTGHSTAALSKISKKTVGCDLSQAMLSVARRHNAIDFVQANAEALPFNESEFDFINISMGYHWLNQDKFLHEVARILKRPGYFCVDNYGFLGKISEDLGKQTLHNDLFEKYLPPATRRNCYPTDPQIKSVGFILVEEIKYNHMVRLDAEDFINLLMTWSNFQIQSDDQKLITSANMSEVYNHVFEGKSRSLEFGGTAMLYRTGHV